jgi:hypothetical protein
MTTFQELSQIIRTAGTRAELDRRETQCERHYQAGTITAREFFRLDGIILERSFILDTIPKNPTLTAP